MLKKILFVVLLLLSLNVVVASEVELTVHIYEEYTIFNYIFSFDINETASNLSFDVPNDVEVDYIVDKNGIVDYKIKNNSLILNSGTTSENVYLVKFSSKQTSLDVVNDEVFRLFQKYDFSVEKSSLEINIKDDFGDILTIFPSSYNMTKGDDGTEIYWSSLDINQDSLAIVNFKKNQEDVVAIPVEPDKDWTMYYIIGGVILICVIVILVIFFVIYPNYLKKHLKKEVKKEIEKKVLDDENESIPKKKISEVVIEKDKVEDSKDVVEVKNSINKRDEIIEKELTDNEQKVVRLVLTEEGISQYDILNNIPTLTKSNLSKIVSKLHAKKILKRIKVGKINHIYIGERLEEDSS